MTVAELQARCDSRELSEWMAFDRIEPPDFWSSTVARLLYWVGCLWSKRPPDFRTFTPSSRPARMSPAEMRIRLRGS